MPKFAFERPSRLTLTRNKRNPSLERLRDQELVARAPFSDRVIVDGWNNTDFTLPYDPDYFDAGNYVETVKDVPIGRILGISCAGHLYQNFESDRGSTFREALFEHLYGGGIIPESLEFLGSDAPKDQEMPQAEGCHESRSGIIMIECDGWFITQRGQQRVIMGMYHIFQRDGVDGTLDEHGDKGKIRNVPVRTYLKLGAPKPKGRILPTTTIANSGWRPGSF